MEKMLLKGFRIQNYEGIYDSGWIESDDITTIIGNDENIKVKILKALWLISDFSESKNSNDLVQERCEAGDKIFISVTYNIPDDIKKEISEITKIDKEYIKDTIEINKSFSGQHSICNFIEEKEWINCKLNEWISKNERKLSKKILNVAKKYKKEISKTRTFSNNIIKEKMKDIFEDMDKLKPSQVEKSLIKKFKKTISGLYISDACNQNIKKLIIRNMPQLIFCKEGDSNCEVLVNGEVLNLKEFNNRIEYGFYERENKGIILLMHNFEKNCNLVDDLDFIDYCKEKFNDIQVIHTTVAPFLLNEANKDKWVVNSDRRFKKEECVKQQTSFKNFIIAMGIGTIVWIIITVLMFKKILKNIDIPYPQKNWVIYINKIWTIIREIAINQLYIWFIVLILLLIFILFKNKLEMKKNDHKISELFSGLLTGQIILPMAIFEKLLPILLGMIIIISSVLGTFFISVIIFPYMAKTFILFLELSLDFINKIGGGIDIPKILLSNDELNWYMILIISFALLPYINEVVVKLTRLIFGFINKPITDTTTKLIRRIANVTSIRAVIYILAFILSMVTFIFEFKNALYIKVIKESMLSFIILDMVSNSIYNYIINLNKMKTKLRRLEFLNFLKKTFNDGLVNKNKFEIYNILYNLENNDDIIFYFKRRHQDSIFNKWKIRKVISDKEYFEDFFWRYNRLKNISIMFKKDYVIFLKGIQETIYYYERVIILS